VNGYQLAAKEWQPGAPVQILALHGWLDNAASFDVLAPILEACHVVALDMPGHGHSDHKPMQATYNLWDDLLDVLAVADLLGWQQFILLGHSRGALMSHLLAAALPERVRAVVMMDAIWPDTVPAAESPQQLAKFLHDNRKVANKRLPSYQSFEQAVAARCRGFLAMEPAAARLIVERALEQVDGVYRWVNDPRLNTASAFKLTQAHNEAFTAALTVPSLLLMAEGGLGGNQQQLQALARFEHIEQRVFAGGHHFHMNVDAAKMIAAVVQEFIKQHL
jgi:pimeloyl-ACP methyl ester carboxylesterase